MAVEIVKLDTTIEASVYDNGDGDQPLQLTQRVGELTNEDTGVSAEICMGLMSPTMWTIRGPKRTIIVDAGELLSAAAVHVTLAEDAE